MRKNYVLSGQFLQVALVGWGSRRQTLCDLVANWTCMLLLSYRCLTWKRLHWSGITLDPDYNTSMTLNNQKKLILRQKLLSTVDGTLWSLYDIVHRGLVLAFGKENRFIKLPGVRSFWILIGRLWACSSSLHTIYGEWISTIISKAQTVAWQPSYHPWLNFSPFVKTPKTIESK